MAGFSFTVASFWLSQGLVILSLLAMPSIANSDAAEPAINKDGQRVSRAAPTNDNDMLSGADDIGQLLKLDSQVDKHGNWRAADKFQVHRQQDGKPTSLGRLFRNQQRPASSASWLSGMAKRRPHIFVGKKSNAGVHQPASGRSFASGPDAATDSVVDEQQRFVGNDEMDDVKRSRMFVGKRPSLFDDAEDSADTMDWLPMGSLGGLRDDDDEMMPEKRSRMFVGKKMAPVFVGKRSISDSDDH